ncbi:glycoside hydrolase family 128 protein [Tylopilus felleus]
MHSTRLHHSWIQAASPRGMRNHRHWLLPRSIDVSMHHDGPSLTSLSSQLNSDKYGPGIPSSSTSFSPFIMLFCALVFLSVFTAATQAVVGLGWPWFNAPLNPGVFNKPGSKVQVIYDWETYGPPSTNGSGGLRFIGMQRCIDCYSSPINALHARWKAQGWTTVFTVNEPDLNGISPTQAAAWYKQHINPLPIQKALPAVSSSVASSQGVNWLSEMIAACAGGCNYDLLNLHWYGASYAQFQSYIESVHAQFPNNKLVISEYALQNPPGGQAAQLEFFKQAFAFLESTPYVELHFPYLATSPALLEARSSGPVDTSSCLYNDDGTPSAIGELLL